MMDQVGITVDIEKASPEGRYVRGFASVVSVNGRPVEDWQGDVIAIDTIRAAAHRFVRDARVAKTMHKGEPVGQIVESMIVDDEAAAALGITDGRRGWWVGMEIDSPEVRDKVVKKQLRAFSIGGSGKRRPADGDAS